ncbi:MAG: SAVED domain-containing protein [Caldilinea sp. CFX5]|nr:SAVED domain-containing protein [Caldilinea sp. CFX5]
MKSSGFVSVPSLLEDASRGGDTNEGGIAFQASVALAYIPKWLAMEGFTSIVREGIFDLEGKFYVPGHSFVMEAIEVKDHQISPTEFWQEIDRFKEVDKGSPGSYQWFTLASAGLSRELHILRNGLRRVRDPYGFYHDFSAIFDNSYREYVERVKRSNRSEEDAEFLYNRVLLVDDLSVNRNHGKAIFKEALLQHLPYHQNLPDRIIENIHAHLDILVRSRRNQELSRKELESKLKECLPPNFPMPVQSIHVFTSTKKAELDENNRSLYFDWELFFGGEVRQYPEPQIWNQQLVGELRKAMNWILIHRNSRRILLNGNRRLSAALATGYVFSAVSGFSIDMNYRNEIWNTDAHPNNETPPYQLHIDGLYKGVTGEHLVVSIGILRDIVKDVETDMIKHGLQGMPVLHIKGNSPILSPMQTNLIVREIKNSIAEALSCCKSRQVDLFIAGPAYLALFLGHRLNATTLIQCYEQAGGGGYVPTCHLS